MPQDNIYWGDRTMVGPNITTGNSIFLGSSARYINPFRYATSTLNNMSTSDWNSQFYSSVNLADMKVRITSWKDYLNRGD